MDIYTSIGTDPSLISYFQGNTFLELIPTRIKCYKRDAATPSSHFQNEKPDIWDVLTKVTVN